MAFKDCAKTLLSVGLSQAVLHTDQVKSCGSLGWFIACVPNKREKNSRNLYDRVQCPPFQLESTVQPLYYFCSVLIPGSFVRCKFVGMTQGESYLT